MTPLFVSFYTAPYAEHAAGLIESLDAHGLDHCVEAVQSGGGWLDNVNRKAAFLLGIVRRHPDRPVVWLDADARVRKPPCLFDTLDCDFAAHWRYGAELLSGTIYLGPTPAARRLCEAWHRQCVLYPGTWDQVNLAAVIERGVEGLRVVRLPASYTRICDAADMGPEIFVEHLQASRELRKVVG